jgi:hypothetical protein
MGTSQFQILAHDVYVSSSSSSLSIQARWTENSQIEFFFGKNLLLAYRVRLDKSFPMGSCSTSGDENSLRYDLGPHHCDCHVSTQ